MLFHDSRLLRHPRRSLAAAWLMMLSLLLLTACAGGAAGEPTTSVSALKPTTAAGPTKLARPSGPTSTAPAPAKTAAAQPSPSKGLKTNSPEYSIQAFLWYRPETADRDLNLIRDMGFGWVKQQFAWRDIEGAAKGAFDWSFSDRVVDAANSKQISILARLDNSPDWAAPGCFDSSKSSMGPAKNTQDWTDFLTAFAKRYKGRIRAYEVWNEPNLAREWCNQPPDPVAFAKFLKASYGAIRSADPNAIIVSGGLTPTTCCADGAQAVPDATYFSKLYDAMGGSSDGYFDALGVHAAGYKAEPEADPGEVAKDPALTNNDPSPVEMKRIYSFRHVEDIRQIMVQRGDQNKQIFITEFGWTSDPVNKAYQWFRVNEADKADRIVRAYKWAKANWSPWIGVMSLIYMANPDWQPSDEKFWWAVDEPNGTPRASYVALKMMQK